MREARIFLGNLPSERTSQKELSDIFSKYGKIEEIVVKKSFGFIQFEAPHAAAAAIKGERGRLIGGLRVGTQLSYVLIH